MYFYYCYIQPGSGECLVCGATTTSLPTRDGCTNSGCKYSYDGSDLEYDFSRLSRVNGKMFTVLNYQVSSPGPNIATKTRQQRSRPVQLLSILPPYQNSYYVNLCTVKHDNSSCISRTSSRAGPLTPLPVMACRTSWWSRQDRSIGRVIGFKPKEDPGSGVIVELLHGDICLKSK